MNDHVSAEELAAYLDGLPDTARKSELEKHFARCRQCLDELVDLSLIMGGKDRVPSRFLEQALGRKGKPAPAPWRLRLVFEVAAALLVVVSIGYFFLSNNRFWQTPDKQTLSDRMGDKAGREDRRPSDLVRATQTPAPGPAEQAANDRLAPVAPAPAKKSRPADSKDLPAAADQAVPAGHDQGALQETAPAMAVPTAERESAAKQEQSRTEAKSKASGPMRLDAAARSRPAAQTLDMAATQTQTYRQQQQQTMGSLQKAGSGEKTSEALNRDETAAPMASLPLRIEGDVAWSNLQNPERILSWTWFPKDLVLELQIDQAGTVIAVAASGKTDQDLADRAASEAKKLIFAISEKKTRRARLLAPGNPPDPVKLD